MTVANNYTMELERLKGRKILVLGDIMLDTYHIGDVKRISPEAPVPVVRVNRSYSVLGGASNVARNLLGLGCVPFVVGQLGEDHNGRIMQDMFRELGIEVRFGLSDCPTITKTRIVGNNQQIVRIDFEDDRYELSPVCAQTMLQAVEEFIGQCDMVVISDYGKGVCSADMCREVIDIAARCGKRVIVDPKGVDWDKYHGAGIITPNTKELSAVYGEEVKNIDAVVHTAARAVIERYDLEALLVTRSEKGMSYVDRDGAVDIPTEAREVYDVSGAGDTVVATLAAALSAGFPMEKAITLSNKAAGIVVGKMGTTPILFDDLQSELFAGNLTGKIIERSQVAGLMRLLRMQHRRVVFTNGCFDILHKGHVVYLEKAKRQGDVLVVGLNTDASVRRLKGDKRPINPQDARACVMAALESVDYVVLFDEDTPYDLIREVAPDVLVKGGDYKVSEIVGREFAGSTMVIPLEEGYSTTAIINRSRS